MVGRGDLGAGRPLFPRRFDLELKALERNGAFACAVYSVVAPHPATQHADTK